MKKTDIDVKAQHLETLRLSAYLTPVEGVAVHRQVVYVPGKEEHKTTSKWQLTHIKSGLGLLLPSQCPETMGEAVAIAEKLSGVVDFTSSEFNMSNSELQSLSKEIANAVVSVASNPPPKSEQVHDSRFVVRKSQGGPGYVVYDLEAENTIESFMHRGLASERARELNEGVDV